MANYKEALNLGFAAAKKAEFARREIQTTIKKFSDDVLEASQGKILINIQRLEETQSLKASIVYRYGVLGLPKEYYLALVASNPKVKDRFRELARWKEAKDGYPCSLTWGSTEHQCEDRSALEECLAELLKDPIIGEILYSISK